MNFYDVAIFDCDGVLLDTRESNRFYYNSILANFGRGSMDESELSFVHMNTAEESLRYLFRDDSGVRKEALDYAKLVDYSPFLEHIVMEPGVEEAIESIRPPILTAVSTNRSTTMPKLIEIFGFDRWFDAIVCALDVVEPKPSPEGVFKILNELGVEKERAIYIGDSKVDEMVAYRAEIPLIAYKNKELRAMFHVEHFSKLKSILMDD